MTDKTSRPASANEPAPNDRDEPDAPDDPGHGADAIAPLPGEPGIPDIAAPHRAALPKKGLLAMALLAGTLIAAASMVVHRLSWGGKRSDGEHTLLTRDKPTAAGAQTPRLDLLVGVGVGPAAARPAASDPIIPALRPAPDELLEPIGVRRTGTGVSSSGPRQMLPEDAPVLLLSARPGTLGMASAQTKLPVQLNAGTAATGGAMPADRDTGEGPNSLAATTRNLEVYQQRLQALMDRLTQSTTLATTQSASADDTAVTPGNGRGITPALTAQGPGSSALFGGQLQGSRTSRVSASMLLHRSLTLPKGTTFTCALKTKVISASSGLVGCEVQRNLYGDDGRVLLVERGSHLDGEYRIASVKPGTIRIPIVWTRIRTPLGVTVELDSPGTGPLGESGIDGYVDNRWPERIGAAMLLSLIDDSVKMVIQSQATTNANGQSTVVLPSTTDNTSKLAEKVLDSTINIPPLVYQNQGGIVGIYVAHDLDFSSVYELQPSVTVERRDAAHDTAHDIAHEVSP